VTDLGMEHLRDLPTLTSFNCYFCEFIGDDAVSVMKSWKKLERVQLRGTKVTSKALEHLAQIPTLRSIDISHTEIDDEGFELLGSLTRLESLSIGANRLEGSALTALKSLPSLRSLNAGGIQRVDSGLWGLALNEANLARLGELTQLTSLDLSGANLSDRGLDRPGHPEAERTEMRDLSALAGLKQLEELSLTRTKVTPDALLQLAVLPKLKRLRLGLTPNLTSEAIEKFAAARPGCVIVR
jgi:Leucine-rich repeat (LRR) protein